MILRNGIYRIYQYVICSVMHKMRYNNKVLSGRGMVYRIPYILKRDDIYKVLIISGPHIIKSDMLKRILKVFTKSGLDYVVFSEISYETETEDAERARKVYINNNCKAIVAIGGGSVIDCAKATAAGIVNPDKQIRELLGYQKVVKSIPVIVAVPTTAGTGSETTTCAVIKDAVTGNKRVIADTRLIPKYAVLDPVLTVSMSKKLTSYTGMDAFTHAIEAYINKYSSANAKKDAKSAIKLIVENLTAVYDNGRDINLRKNMLEASYLAGRAFTRTSVGYVHAIGHAIGGRYNLPHGMAVSVVLPYVLTWYGKSIYIKLAELADSSEVSAKNMTVRQKSKAFIKYIDTLNKRFGIVKMFKVSLIEHANSKCITKKDIEEMAKCAIIEANPYYPVPKIMSQAECENIIQRILTTK